MENENVLTDGKNIMIINGGNALGDCPTDWDEANVRIEKMNQSAPEGIDWSFDCGFKLDFDGTMLSVSSRFYPPKTHSGATWDGNSKIYFFNEVLYEKNFDCPTLPQLEKEVTEWLRCQIEIIKSKLTNP